MSNYDPRTLIRKLNDLKEEVQKFTQTSSDTLKRAEDMQSYAQERVNQALRWSAIATNQVKSDLEDVQEVETEVNSLLSQCSTAIDIAHETVAAVEQAQQQAEETLERWQAELQLALAWQARAEERLERAIRAFQRAERNLESAKRDLERTQANLERCAKDPERKNCNSEQRAYNNARAAVLQAIEELKVAETEVQAAQEELKMAKARVRCCQSAVDYAEQAVQHAHSAMEQAKQALNDAERSLESAESANRAATNAQAKATEAEEQAEQVVLKVRQAETVTNEARVHTQVARSTADSAYYLAKMGTKELRDRVDELIKYNQVYSSFQKASSLPEDENNTWNKEYVGSFNKNFVEKIPPNLKGLYYIHSSDLSSQYLGKSDDCIRGRLQSHLRCSSNSSLRAAVASGTELFFYCWESPDPKYEEALEIKRLKGEGNLMGQRNERKPLIYLD